jgi:hypothetical protein
MSEVDNPRVIRKKIIRIKLELKSSIPPDRRLKLEQDIYRLEERLEELTSSTDAQSDSPIELRARDLVA